MHPDHRVLLGELRRLGHPSAHGQAYVGSAHPHLGVAVPEQRRLAKRWLAEHKGAPPETGLAVADSLFQGGSHTEKSFAAILLACSRPAQAAIRSDHVDRWLDQLHGWAEIDCLCQGTITAAVVMANWRAWEALVSRLAADPNINRRRAALVLLVNAVRDSDDARPAAAALRIIDALKAERAILITKAVSWLLRSMLKRHRDAALAYVEANRASLPAVAVREFTRKAETGRK